MSSLAKKSKNVLKIQEIVFDQLGEFLLLLLQVVRADLSDRVHLDVISGHV